MGEEVVICRYCKTRYLGRVCPVCRGVDTDLKGVDKFDNDYTDLGLI